jgi:hypothetical protein
MNVKLFFAYVQYILSIMCPVTVLLSRLADFLSCNMHTLDLSTLKMPPALSRFPDHLRDARYDPSAGRFPFSSC